MRHPPRSVLKAPPQPCPVEHFATVCPRDAGTGSAVSRLDGATRTPDAGTAHSCGTPHGRSGPRTPRTADRTPS